MQIYETLIEPNFVKSIDLELCFYGKEECLGGHSWGPGVRHQYIIHYIHSGQGMLTIGDKRYPLSAGQGFLICPNSIVYYKADEADPWVYSWVGFQGLHAKSYLERANLSISRPFFQSRNKAWFDHLFGEILKIQSQDRSSDLQYKSLIYQFFGELIELAAGAAPALKPITTKEMYIQKAMEYIEINFSQKISILDIAHNVGLDRTYLSCLFKAKLGLSLQLFLLQFRMNRACDLMSNAALSIGDISRSVGYPDPFLFSKMFKKINKVSPKKYREELNR